MFGRKHKPKDIIKEAERIVNTHSYGICTMCNKNCIDDYCLPVEMFSQIIQEPDEKRLEILENIEYLFTDDV